MKNNLLILCGFCLITVPALGQSASNLIATGRVFLAQKNITNANANFRAAVTLSPTDETANALYAVTRVLVLPIQSPVKEFLDRLGVSQTNRSIYHWNTKVPRDTNGVPLAPSGVNASEARAILRTNILTEISAAAANLSKVTHTNFILNLTRDETTITDLTVDYGDVLMLRAMLHAAEYFCYTIYSWNVDVQLAAIRSLFR